jgi:hypothetical protein
VKLKQYAVRWRHQTWDRPDYPYRGSGHAWGRTKREALRNYFNPFGVGGDTTHLCTIQDEFYKGNIEIREMRRV